MLQISAVTAKIQNSKMQNGGGEFGRFYGKEIFFICKFFSGVYIYCNFSI